MTTRNYINLVGQTIQGFDIETIVGYERLEPIYGCHCLTCNASSVPIPHRAFRNGNPKCVSSLHPLEKRHESETLTQMRIRERKEAAVATRAAEEAQAEAEANAVKQREKAAQIEAERLRYAQYYRHQLGTAAPLSAFATFERWQQLPAATREYIIDRISKDPAIWFDNLNT